jgi:hypothetical protein
MKGKRAEKNAIERQQSIDMFLLLDEARMQLGCSCDRPSVPPCGSCVLIPKIEKLLDSIDGGKRSET